METNEFYKLFNIIIKRAKTGKGTSYTKKLLKNGAKKIAQKVGEESTELIIDYLKGSKKRTIEEAVDLIYHIHFSVFWYSPESPIQPVILSVLHLYRPTLVLHILDNRKLIYHFHPYKILIHFLRLTIQPHQILLFLT